MTRGQKQASKWDGCQVLARTELCVDKTRALKEPCVHSKTHAYCGNMAAIQRNPLNADILRRDDENGNSGITEALQRRCGLSA